MLNNLMQLSSVASLTDKLEKNLTMQLHALQQMVEMQRALNDKFLPILELFETDMRQAIEQDKKMQHQQTPDCGDNAERRA